MSVLSTKVELHLRCRNLPKKDLLSQSDPFVVVYLKEKTGGAMHEVFRTKTIDNQPNPDFEEQIVLEYFFEQSQVLRFDVFDRDSSSEDLKKHHLLGSCQTSLGKIMGSRDNQIMLNLDPKERNPNSKNQSFIVISGQEVNSCADMISFSAYGVKLIRKNFFGLGSSDPFFVVKQMMEDENFKVVFKSQVVKKNLNPKWSNLKISVQQLCNGDLQKPLRFEVFDWESSGKHQLIGAFDTNVNEIIDVHKTKQFSLVKCHTNKTKTKTSSAGLFKFDDFAVEKRYSFLEYLAGGMQINLMVAIDFTASNGHPLDAKSLHRVETGKFNQYEQSILQVGQVLEPYDNDNLVPCFGFGAQLQETAGGLTSHCFPLSFDSRQENVKGLRGVMESYKEALHRVNLSGPTNFASIIAKARELANENGYLVLLIMTDGQITDMNETICEIVKASSLPLSIVIIGVGDADFQNMEALDGDKERLYCRSTKSFAARDIVQFVQFNNFKSSPSLLAEEVLREVPGQVVSYFESKNIAPKPLVKAEPFEVKNPEKEPVPKAQVVSLDCLNES